MHPVEQAIWLVESRLWENPKVGEISKATGLSRFYVARIFVDATGRSLSAYIRGRRLTEAARALAASAQDVMSVALATGYGSHEAFTRAFRAQFGVTPDHVRRSRDLTKLELVEPIRMNAPQRVPLSTPAIETLPAASYVGLTRNYRIEALGAIPEQWNQFQAYLKDLDPAKVGGAYGIVRNSAPNGESVDYACVIKAGLGLEPGGPLQTVNLPAMRIAKFAHKGHISGIKATAHAIFTQELPRAGLRPRGPVDLIEFYGPEFDPVSGFGTVELWIQVEG